MQKSKAQNNKVQNIYALSPMQEGMLFHALMDEAPGTYIEQTVISLKGTVDPHVLKNALDRIIERYDVLRTIFTYKNTKRPRQVVLTQGETEFNSFDISGSDPEEKSLLLEDFVAKDKERGFDLTKGPLIRLALFKTGIDTWKLVWSFHHIIMDGWCLGLMFQDFITIGSAIGAGKSVILDPVSPYSRYIQWIEKQDKSKALVYWKTLLEGFEQSISLPRFNDIFKNKADKRGYKRGIFRFTLEESLAGKIRQLAQNNHVTENTVFQVIWGILLQRYNDTDDVVFGTVVSGRPPEIPGIDRMIGLFINTVPVRIKCFENSETTFSQLLKMVQNQAAQSKSYEYLSLAEIQSESLLKSELINHILVFENYPLEEQMKEVGHERDLSNIEYDISVEDLEMFEQTNYDLNLLISPGKELKLTFMFNLDVYELDLIKNITRQFEEIIRNVVNAPDIKIETIDMISRVEKRILLEELNSTASEWFKEQTVFQLFEIQVEKTPDRVAAVGPAYLIDSGDGNQLFNVIHLTYKELNGKVGRVTRCLLEKGIKPDSIVAIYVDRSIEMLIGILGILGAGAAYLPLDSNYPKERIAFMLKDSGTSVVLTNYDSEDLSFIYEPGKQPGTQFTEVIDIKKIASEDSFSTPHVHYEPRIATDLAYIIYTSGSTGKPKGVMIENRNLVNLIQFQFTRTKIDFSRVLQFTTICFDVSAQEIFSTLLNGGCLALVDKQTQADIQALLQKIRKERLRTLFLPVSVLRMLMNETLLLEQIPETVKHIVTAGEQLIINEAFRDYIKLKEIYLHNHYGPSETHVVTTLTLNPSEDIPLFPTIGRPISNTAIYILDKRMNLSPLGAAGELVIAGAQVGRGYLNRPELTDEKFVYQGRFLKKTIVLPLDPTKTFDDKKESKSFGPTFFKRLAAGGILYRTGDLARWLSDGNIEFLGRTDHQIKIRGFRIELGEIENELNKHRKIKESAVSVIEDQKGDKHLAAYYVSEHEIPEEELTSVLLKTLPDYMIPSSFTHLESLPLTPSKKINRKALPIPNTNKIKVLVSPVTPVEIQLADIWADVLGIPREKISVEDSFFQLGGHSLKATILTSRIHKEFNIKVPLPQFFKIQTIRGLTSFIKQAKKVEYEIIEHVEEKEYYPLSSTQKRLYFLHQLDLNSIAYNMPLVLPVNENEDVSRLELIFKKLIDRHESFRTSFITVDEQPVQRIHQKVDFSVGFHRLSREESPSIRTLFTQPFDLSRAPLLRANLVSISPDNTKETVKENGPRMFLFLDVHHIISDGTSEDILKREFSTLYLNPEADLPPLPLQYKDYSEWANNRKHHEIIREQQEYWMREFSGELPVLNLPTDFPRPLVQGVEGNHVNFALSDEETRFLKTLTNENDITLYMILLAVFNVLFSKLSGQEDIILGTPIAARRHTALQNMLGMLVNTLAMRNYPTSGKVFRNFLKEIKQRTLDAYENQEYPFEELVEKIAVTRDSSRSPVFDIMLNVLNQSEYLDGECGIEMEPPYRHTRKISRFDLLFYVYDTGKQIYFGLEYSTRLFLPSTIEQMIEYFKNLIAVLPESMEKEIGEIDITSPKEKEKILEWAWGPQDREDITSNPLNVSIHRLFEVQVQKTPDHIAITGPSSSNISYSGLTAMCQVTYRELNEKANAVAAFLVKNGVQHKTIIALKINRSVEMIIAILGILKAGGAYLPIDPLYPQDLIDYMIKDSGAKIILTEMELAKHLQTNDFTNALAPCGIASDMAYVIYTSGTTGKPKGVIITHGNLVNLIRFQYLHTNIDFSKVLQFTTICFDVSAQEIFSTLLSGGNLILIDKQTQTDIGALFECVRREFIRTLFLPASFLKFVMNENVHARSFPSAVRHIVTAGEQLIVNDTFKNVLIENGIFLHNHYGPSETHVVTTLTIRPSIRIPAIPSIGRPISETTIYILDKRMNLTPYRVAGELFIGGAQVGLGYLNRPELTAEKFIHQGLLNQKFLEVQKPFYKKVFGSRREYLYRTGDLARWLEDGNIEFLGRIDQQVKIRGFRIELEEIESRLLEYKDIKEAVVIVKEATNAEKYLCGYVVSVSGNTIDANRIKNKLSKQLPGYMVPTAIVSVDSIPLTPNGKVDKKALPEPLMNFGSEYVGPADEIEYAVAEMLAEELCLPKEKINTYAGFFELGGHSLKAATIVAKIQKQFNITFPLIEFFRTPTVKAASDYIRKELKSIQTSHRSTKETQDHRLVLLKKASIICSEPRHLFLIHDGTGELEGYVEFCKQLKISPEFNIWGIRSAKLEQMSPINTSIGTLAGTYIQLIEIIQPLGPICIAGWSLGGTIAFEIAHRLEEKKRDILFLALIDSISPAQMRPENTHIFGIESEISFLSQFVNLDQVSILAEPLKKLHRIDEFWPKVLEYLQSQNFDPGTLKEIIRTYGIHTLPNFDILSISESIYYLNMGRTLSAARSAYRPNIKIKTPINYIYATESEKRINKYAWENYSEHSIAYFPVEGDHYSILKHPNVIPLSELFSRILADKILH